MSFRRLRRTLSLVLQATFAHILLTPFQLVVCGSKNCVKKWRFKAFFVDYFFVTFTKRLSFDYFMAFIPLISNLHLAFLQDHPSSTCVQSNGGGPHVTMSNRRAYPSTACWYLLLAARSCLALLATTLSSHGFSRCASRLCNGSFTVPHIL